MGDFGGLFCPFLLLLALVTGLDWAGLGCLSLSPGSTAWRMYACLVCTCALVTSHERTNERMHVLAPHHLLGEPLTAVCVEPPARSGGGGDMCGLPKVE